MNFDGLTITIGAPGAGKSTWADKNLPGHVLRLERDRFREALFGSRRAYHESMIERGDRSLVVTSCMLAAMEAWPYPACAVADTGLRYEAVSPFIDLAVFLSSSSFYISLFSRSIYMAFSHPSVDIRHNLIRRCTRDLQVLSKQTETTGLLLELELLSFE